MTSISKILNYSWRDFDTNLEFLSRKQKTFQKTCALCTHRKNHYICKWQELKSVCQAFLRTLKNSTLNACILFIFKFKYINIHFKLNVIELSVDSFTKYFSNMNFGQIRKRSFWVILMRGPDLGTFLYELSVK